MKSIYQSIIIMVVVVCLASCSTTEKFYVSGTPNTKIYTPSHEHVGTIDSKGKVQIELTSDYFYAYLLSKSPDSDIYVPFALDYKKRNTAGAQFLAWTGLGASLAGSVTMLVGALMEGGDEGSGVGMAVGGGVAALSGLAFGAPAGCRMDQTSYEYQFKYRNNQRANSDLNLTKTVLTEPFKNRGEIGVEIVPSVEETSVSKKQLTEKSAKTLKDYGKQIAKVYVGTGSLKQGNSIIESYNDIKVVIERVSKNEVRVNVTEASGSNFFENYSIYKVERNKNGSFLLTHSKIKDATITIGSNGKLKYNHPKVNIDGEIYHLQITVSK